MRVLSSYKKAIQYGALLFLAGVATADVIKTTFTLTLGPECTYQHFEKVFEMFYNMFRSNLLDGQILSGTFSGDLPDGTSFSASIFSARRINDTLSFDGPITLNCFPRSA